MNPLFKQKAPKIVADLMRDFSLDVISAAAIVGNGGHESGGFAKLQEIKPTVKGSRGGYGYFQWTGARRRAFEAWCTAKGLKPSSDDANYGFLCEELRGSEKAALTAVRKAGDLATKVKAFEASYERAGVKHYDSRLAYATAALEAYRASPQATTTTVAVTVDKDGKVKDSMGKPVSVASPFQEDTTPPPPKKSAFTSPTVLSTVGAVGASGGLGFLSFIESPYALAAFALILVFAAVIIWRWMGKR